MIIVNSLTKEYKAGSKAVDDFSFTINKNETVALHRFKWCW